MLFCLLVKNFAENDVLIDNIICIEKIARYVPALSMEELKEIEAEVMQLA